MDRRFWSNKKYVEDWLNNLDGFDYEFSAKTLGKGCRGVELFVHYLDDIKLFMEKYSQGKSEYANFYLTPNYYTKGSPFYVSIKKLK